MGFGIYTNILKDIWLVKPIESFFVCVALSKMSIFRTAKMNIALAKNEENALTTYLT